MSAYHSMRGEGKGGWVKSQREREKQLEKPYREKTHGYRERGRKGNGGVEKADLLNEV